MKTAVRFVFCLLCIISLVSIVGCAKKTEPKPPSTSTPAPKPAPTATQPKPAPAPAAPAPAPAGPNQPSAGKLTTAVLAAVSLDYVKKDAARMNVDQLKAKATDYKNAIVARKNEIIADTAKLKQIPATQSLNADAKTLQTNIANLTKTVGSLTERFQIYNDKLKELGGTPLSLTE
jgi:3-oxoacyl-ACP reductase-like protein